LLSLVILGTGLLLPIAAATTPGRRLIQRLAFPAPPLALAILFVGAYAYGRYYYPEISAGQTRSESSCSQRPCSDSR